MDPDEQCVNQRADDLGAARIALLDALRAVSDPVKRANLAGPLVTRFEVGDEVAQARREAIAEARAEGATWTAIGRALGISAARAQQIVTGRRR